MLRPRRTTHPLAYGEATRARRAATRAKLDQLTRRCRDCGAVAQGHAPIVHIPGCGT